MFWKLLLILLLICYPVWLLQKLARYGKGIFRPNFERMQRKIDEWVGISNNGWMAWNRPAGKLLYYLLLFYVFTGILVLIYGLAK
jgi:hypothetical protein